MSTFHKTTVSYYPTICYPVDKQVVDSHFDSSLDVSSLTECLGSDELKANYPTINNNSQSFPEITDAELMTEPILTQLVTSGDFQKSNSSA